MTQPTPPPIDTDELPPTQYLILEVLAARHRLGETLWTFPTRLRSHISQLADIGLIGWKGGVTEGTVRAWLTDAGQAATLSPTYEPPAARKHEPGMPGWWCGRCSSQIDGCDDRACVCTCHDNTAQPTPPYVQADIDRAARALAGARQSACFDFTGAHWEGERDLHRQDARAVLDALAAAGRLADQPDWRGDAVLIERTVAVSPWTETTEEPA